MRKDVADYQSTTVTDESLRVSNDKLTLEVNDLQVQIETLGEENLKLRHKVIHFYRENERLSKLSKSSKSPDNPDKLQGISDEVLGAFIRSRVA